LGIEAATMDLGDAVVEPRPGPTEVPHLGIARASLVFCAFMYAILGVSLGPMGGLAWLSESDGTEMPGAFHLVFGLIMLVVCLGVAAVNIAAAWGLGDTSRKWAWWVALILGMIYVPSACLPFGLAIVMPLISKEARARFGV
jgi:hypothetical protein